MGTRETDKCIFCKCNLEKWDYEYFVENGERAGTDLESYAYGEMDICKNCITKLKQLLR